jgi:polysaccharide biosynthesis transport protein
VNQVAGITPVPVLTSVPEIVTWDDRQRQKTRRRNMAVGAAVALAIGVVVFHFFIMDLDVFWTRLMRQFRI